VQDGATNKGALTTLQVDNDLNVRSFLRFSLSGLSGASVTRATLRLWANSALSAGFAVRPVADNTWTESGIVATNAPPFGTASVLSGAVTTGTWVSVDVTSLQQQKQGAVSLGLAPRSTTALSLSSREGANPPQLVVETGAAPADNPPTVPTGLSAPFVSASSVNLTWSASTDGDATPVAGYHVFRDGVQIGDVTTTSFSDTTVAGGQTYSYTVSAYDTATPANESARSVALSVTTPPGAAGSGTFVATADAYVTDGVTTNTGKSTQLRVDNSPVTTSFLRFTLSGLSGATVTSATLRLMPTASLSAGFAVRPVADNTWSETAIVAANAPPFGATGPLSGAVSSGVLKSIDVTSLVTSPSGNVSLALVGLSSTNLPLMSREAATKPELVVTTG